MLTSSSLLRRQFAGLVLVAVIAAFSFSVAPAQGDGSSASTPTAQHWVSTWAVSPQTQDGFPGVPAPAAPSFSNQTLRQIIHTSIGGQQVRVRFSNLFGTNSLVIGAASIGLYGGGAQTVAGSYHALMFGGRSMVTIPPGALVVSDPTNLNVGALDDLAISIYLPITTQGTTLHIIGSQTNYIADGDQTATDNLATSSTMQMYAFLKNVEVIAPKTVGAIVCLGDSITDGAASTPDANHRWPNFLAQRLLARSNSAYELGVINQGIGGNRLYHNATGPDILSRFDSDVVAQAGVTSVILLAGINDIGFGEYLPDQVVSADDIIAAYRQLITRAHEAGLKIYGATLTPFAGAFTPYYSDEGEMKRELVNAYIRTGGEFDGVIDFEAAVRDTSNPPRILPQYDCGDHLHPNDAGYEMMASVVKLKFFRSGN